VHKLEVITYKVAISTCEKGQQLQQALHLLRVLQRHVSAPIVIPYNAVISASGASRLYIPDSDAAPCHHPRRDHLQRIMAQPSGLQYQQTLRLLRKMQRHTIVPNVITCNAASRARMGQQFQQALHLLRAMQRHAPVPEGIAYNEVQCCQLCGRKGSASPVGLTPLSSDVAPCHRVGYDYLR